MVKLFLDANVFIDQVSGRNTSFVTSLNGYPVYVSALSISIWMYVYKVKLNPAFYSVVRDEFNILGLSNDVVIKSFNGPTDDYEDNLQLNSAFDEKCSYFFTNDRKVLNLHNIQDMRIIAPKDFNSGLY